jgi:hypothetical protein
MELSTSVYVIIDYHDLHRMGSVNFVVIVESARSLITTENDDLKQFHIPSIVAVSSALGTQHSHPFLWQPMTL